MKKGAITRFIIAVMVCIMVIFYNNFSFINVKKENEETKEIVIKNEGYKDSQTQKNENNTSKKENIKETVSLEETKTESTPTSADEVKGKIKTQYISPYNAPVSYNKVYLKNNTELKIDIKTILNSNLTFKIEKGEKPQVLVLHTHATETFMTEDIDFYTAEYTSRSRDNEKNMVKIGKIVTENLNSAGIKTLHSTTQHDYPNYSGSYSRAAETICSYLKKYPSIKVVLDLHRDAVTDQEQNKVKLVTEINGKKAAQVMIVMGSQSGSVSNFPNWKENFKLAVKLQQVLEVKYPTLARPLSLNSKNYNESLTNGSLLIEFGTDANTLQEAEYSAELVSNALIQLLNSLT